MSSTQDIRAGIVARLETMGVFTKVYEWAPTRAVEMPCAFVVAESGSFQQGYGAAPMAREFSIYVLVARGLPQEEQEDQIDQYIGRGDDPHSVWKAVDGDGTLGGACERAWVTGWDQYGRISLNVGTQSQEYAGVRFAVEVWA